jgi:hypothetical protein
MPRHREITFFIKIFFHPDYTVGTVVATVRPFGSRTLPPVGELHPTLKNFDCKFLLSALFLQGIYAKKGKLKQTLSISRRFLFAGAVLYPYGTISAVALSVALREAPVKNGVSFNDR